MDRPIIDFHARLHPHPGSPDQLLAVMDRHGFDRAVVCAGGVIDPYLLANQVIWGGHVETDADNDAVLAGCQGSGGRLVPFYFANPHRIPESYRARAGAFRGLEISPAVHGVPLTDERTMAFVSVAAELRHPVYIVSLGRHGCGTSDLVRLAEKFPDVNFVLGHCGFIGIDFPAVDAVADRDNIVVETSGCYTAVARAALNRLGTHRVVFGTEYPGQDPAVELAKFRALGLTGQQWKQVAWTNAHRLLGDEGDE